LRRAKVCANVECRLGLTDFMRSKVVERLKEEEEKESK